MQSTRSYKDRKEGFGLFTRMLAGVCLNCPMCGSADRKPGSRVGREMRWQRSWCPGWKACSRVYGDEPIRSDTLYPQPGCDCFDDLD
jgi:hypothetical protein